MNLDDIQPIFFQECDEGLAVMETGFAAIRRGEHDGETINTLFRAVHSIKGGAGAFGHERLQIFTHQYETVLDMLRNGTLALDADLFDLIVAAFAMLADHVVAARDHGTPPIDAPMLARLDAAATPTMIVAPVPVTIAPALPAADDRFDSLFDMLAAPAVEEPIPADWIVRIKPPVGALDHGGEPVLLLRELAFLGGTVVSADLGELPMLDALQPHNPYLTWTIALPGSVAESDIHAVFDFMDGGVLAIVRADAPVTAATSPAPAPLGVVNASPPQPQTIRVDLDALGRLIDLVGKLVITQAKVAHRLSGHDLGDVAGLTDLVDLTRAVQQSAMAIPLAPVVDSPPAPVTILDRARDRRHSDASGIAIEGAAVHGLSDATFLGDGRVALILDVDALVARRRADARRHATQTDIAA